MSVLNITSSTKTDRVNAQTAAERIYGDPYFAACPVVVLKDQYGRDVNSIHEMPTYLPGMRFCHDPSDVIDTESNLTRSAWVYATNQPVYSGGINCGVNGGHNAYDTMALYRDQQDQPVYQLMTGKTEGADDFGAEVELVEKATQSRNRAFGFAKNYYNAAAPSTQVPS